jgi:hypothetical protein
MSSHIVRVISFPRSVLLRSSTRLRTHHAGADSSSAPRCDKFPTGPSPAEHPTLHNAGYSGQRRAARGAPAYPAYPHIKIWGREQSRDVPTKNGSGYNPPWRMATKRLSHPSKRAWRDSAAHCVDLHFHYRSCVRFCVPTCGISRFFVSFSPFRRIYFQQYTDWRTHRRLRGES